MPKTYEHLNLEEQKFIKHLALTLIPSISQSLTTWADQLDEHGKLKFGDLVPAVLIGVFRAHFENIEDQLASDPDLYDKYTDAVTHAEITATQIITNYQSAARKKVTTNATN